MHKPDTPPTLHKPVTETGPGYRRPQPGQPWPGVRPHGRLPVLALLLILLLTLTAAARGQYTPPHSRPGPAVEQLIFKAFDVDRAALDLAAGEMDIYYFGLKTAAAREYREREGLQFFEAPATTLSLLLNPAPAPPGQLNPFSLPAVRRAMQHLIDRDFVAGEIYLGQAQPMFTHLSASDFDYLTIFDTVEELDLHYDPEYGREEIRRAMSAAGATPVDGIWHYNGQPIRLKLVIRVEDERRQIGDLVRTELTNAGFAVDPTYQPFAPALQTVYASDPQQLGWHIYTEGWGRGAPNRYDFGSINSMVAPWLGNMPGWRELGFWQYENPELDALGQRLFRGEFADRAERNALYRQMTQLGLEESVRIWVATVRTAFPARSDLQGITEDLASGPRGIWSLREAYIPNQDQLTVGHLWVWTERTTWNPIGGLSDLYSTDIWRNLSDPPLWNHPFTGIPGPFRIDYQVETSTPGSALAVPADAVMWNVERQSWRPVGEAITATSKVTFDYSRYFQAPWHHGPPITMADVVYAIYQSFDMAYNPDKARIEIAMATTARPYLHTFQGFRVLDDHRLEVYANFWHFEPDYIASYANPTGLSTPWELLHAMDILVFEQRRAAYSDTAASRFNVPWLSLVMDRDARLVRRVLLEQQSQATMPERVFAIPIADGSSLEPAAAARYQAALDWFDRTGHLVISNGPFTLSRYDPPAQFASLTAFRDPNYPFKPGDLYKGRPQLVQFVESSVGPMSLGEPYTARITLSGPGQMAVRYLLTDMARGQIVAKGDAEPLSATEFSVALSAEETANLDLGLYQLVLAASSDQLASLTERRQEIEVGLDALEATAPTAEPAATAPTAAAAADTPAAAPSPPAATATPAIAPTATPTPTAAVSGGTNPGTIVAVIVLLAALGLGGYWYLRRRRPPTA